MLKNLRTDLELPCRLSWGTDPKIQLRGTAIELRPDFVTVRLEDSDPRLVPQPGRKVEVAIDWPADARTPEKQLTCRAVVERALEGIGSGVRVACAIRRGRFTDAKRAAKTRAVPAISGGGWTM
ncbi:MAG TPA: hypothetical protein VFL57_18620 [Bryobacteraceae bacterium]|nr:hypothetical protein [Bryobacteraceae bacterium]